MTLTFAAQTLALESGVPGGGGPASSLLFFVCALLTCVSAWAVVVSQSIVRMSVYLLLTLAGVAGYYLMLHAEFLAAVQLIVYAGGTLILIVFGIMLTSKNPFMQLRVKDWELLVGVGTGLGLGGLIVWALINTVMPEATGSGLGGGYGQVAAIGRALLSDYLVPFELAGVLLLVVMVGAAYIARRRVEPDR